MPTLTSPAARRATRWVLRCLVGCMVPTALLAASPSAGTAPAEGPPPIPVDLPGQATPFRADSGAVENTTDRLEPVWETVAGQESATWVRVFFGVKTHLRRGSQIRLTSMLDGAVQHLGQEALRQWNHSSAYFNGSQVLVELLAAPRGQGDRLVLDGLWTGTPQFGTESICGVDDRVLSSDPRSGRMLSGGCTGWLINECLLGAGHCAGSNSVVQFNVPLSTSSGSLNHPPPADQYTIDTSSLQFLNGGLGNDWAYFGVFPNTETGLTPLQAQGDRYILASNVPQMSGQTLRITGYGVDSTPSDYNQVQQTDIGPYRDFTGTVLQYEVDTTGGNSGSAVVEESTGRAFGIHTNAGCDSSPPPYNHATAINHADLQSALRNPIGVCANQPACNGDGVCNPGEDCFSCPTDCIYKSPGATCGDAVCSVADGEDCFNCAADCNAQLSGPPGSRFCCGNTVGCEDSRCTGQGNTCSSVAINGSGYCCGDGTCENAEDDVLCSVDCAACTPTAEVVNLQVGPGGPGVFVFSWDASSDPCLDHYVLLGAQDPSSAAGFSIVANTGTSNSFTSNPPFTYFLVVLENAAGERGVLGHFGQ